MVRSTSRAISAVSLLPRPADSRDAITALARDLLLQFADPPLRERQLTFEYLPIFHAR